VLQVLDTLEPVVRLLRVADGRAASMGNVY
jgi:hypothetical protein